MKILGIETSCDETSVAIVEDGIRIIANLISSQIDIHKEYGGVVPELAARKHIEAIMPLIEKSLAKSELKITDIDAFAVTFEPGLIGALLVGVSAAKALAFALDKPLIPVNHILAHLFSANLEYKIDYPVIGLIVSGGHTLLLKADDYVNYTILGGTVDDAAGESFDKVAKMLEIGYPGGPAVERLSAAGASNINFPKPMIKEKNYNFSFSGLKTAVLNYIRNTRDYNAADICASFQSSVFETLLVKTLRAVDEFGVKTIVVGGGVAANKTLKKLFERELSDVGCKVYFPSLQFCTDNAAMIAGLAFFQYNQNNAVNLSLNPNGRFI